MKTSLNFILLAFCFLSVQKTFAQIQYSPATNKDGINVFEPSKDETLEFRGFKRNIGGSFTQGYQSLSHDNGVVTTTAIKLCALGSGFNLAAANLNFDIQLADGIRVYLENYMASRLHNEFWVKGGYVQIDKLPMFNNPEWYTKYLRGKMGHMEVNYGDQHFRRSDGGNSIFNPFVESHILDQFATEIGGKLYIFPYEGLMLMGGLTNGLIRNDIFDYRTNAGSNTVKRKNPAILAKVAYDKNFNEDLKSRLSVSHYSNAETPRSTIYSGDRTGSNYFGVLENATWTNSTTHFTSGRFSPGTMNFVTAFMINPFIKYRGMEFFCTYEIANHKIIVETENRKTSQYSVEGVYRFLEDEQAFLGVRYNSISSRLQGYYKDMNIDRLTISAGWFPLKYLLPKENMSIKRMMDLEQMI